MWLKSFILCILVFIHYIIADVGDECEPNSQLSEGICTLITNCEVAIRSIKNKGHHQFERCGFQGKTEIVCCPQATAKFGSSSTEQTRTMRVADRECEKIVKSNLPPLGPHIINGETAALGEFPHMVAVGFDRGNGFVFDCGGALVSKNFVVTAAHCVDNLEKVRPSMVRAGVIEIGGSDFNEGTDYKISELIVHPDYKRREKYNDIALLRLEKSVEFSSNLNAICLYTSNQDPRGALTVTGWGRISTSRDIRSNVLLQTTVKLVDSAKCSESYTNWRKLPRGIDEGQLCAGDPEGLHDTCQGDSGGPLQVPSLTDLQYRLVGVTSFGRGCGSIEPGVYTRISHFVDWIESNVWPN